MTVMRIVANSNNWTAAAIGTSHALLPSFFHRNLATSARNRVLAFRIHGKLYAARNDRVKLPSYDCDGWNRAYPVSEFLSQQPRNRAMLNSSFLPTNRCRKFNFKSVGVGGTFHGIAGFAKLSDKMAKKKSSKELAKAKTGLSAKKGLVKEKRRTRSNKEYEYDSIIQQSSTSHVPVMLGEVLEVLSSRSIGSFVDCTLGAAGHSSAIIQAHPELTLYIGMDVDPLAHEKAQALIKSLSDAHSNLKAQTLVKNFRHIKSVLCEVDENLPNSGVDGILMDLGMSSMQVNNPERGFSVLANGPLDMRMDPQASLTAEDILNSWPDTEVGQILRDYGEESNWRLLQKKIVQARFHGGLHTTGELVDLIRGATPASRGGRQGWIKTATRVFQALRIAVNDELKTLENSLYACFDCLAPGGRLAVISFHSLEDRIVKQTFLNIINCNKGDKEGSEEESGSRDMRKLGNDCNVNETWIRQMVRGSNGTILTKRPITPSEEEERLNRRSRSAKLRVIQKAWK